MAERRTADPNSQDPAPAVGAAPSQSGQVVDAGGSTGHGAGGGLPPEVRALGAMLAVDLLLGVWLALHARGAITAYLAPQLPVIGIGGLAWGFLPDVPKKAFGVWLAERLAAPLVLWCVLVCGAGGLGASLFVSTVVVDSVDPSVSTTVHVVRGTTDRVDSAAMAASHELRLNRLTTPQRKHLLVWPLGARVWLYTPTHVSVLDPTVLPWIPARLQYPDDFERMVTIEVLPTDLTLAKLSHADVLLSVAASDGSGDMIARGTLHDGSARIAFTEPSAIGPGTLDRWRELLQATEDDPDFVEPMLHAWQRTRWIRAGYPLRVNQELQYEAHSASGESYERGTVRLNDVVTQLRLSF